MQRLFFIAAVLVLLFSCTKKDSGGTVLYNIKFTTEQISVKKSSLEPSALYTQFGDYITSLTPEKFIARIWTVGYIDKVMEPGTNNANMLQYIEQNADKLSYNDTSRVVDFTGNKTVSFNPVIYGRVNNNRQFEDPSIDFKYFYFIPYYFYQEVQLPSQYNNIQLEMFPGTSVSGNVLKVKHSEMLRKIFPNSNVSGNIYLIFGNTDSTFVVNKNGENVGLSEDCPIAEPGHDLTIRSHKYTNMIYTNPPEGTTIVMNGVLSFNTINLIQVYAGADNIPYTNDDIFVYAPKFWENIYSRLDIE